METKTTCPDDIIEELGGCGKYQIRMSVLVHVMKTLVCFSNAVTVLVSYTPTWHCSDDVTVYNASSCDIKENGSVVSVCPLKSCVNANRTQCTTFYFAKSFRTIVSEFQLVCDKEYVPSTVMTLQVAGTLAGNALAGQIADLIGRKPPFFASIIILIAANLLGFFSASWVMFGVSRFFVGLGAGFFLTTEYNLLSEFSLAKWRVWIVGFPSWPIESCILALLAWLIHDWRYLLLMSALIGLPCLLSWWVIPESFRWYLAHDKPQKAKEILQNVAAYNRHTINLDNLLLDKPELKHDTRYTFLHLFKTKQLVKISALSACNWFALGLVTFGINFGIQALSGNIFLNFFLFFLIQIPSKAVALWLQNRFGRRASTMLCFFIVGVSGFIVGIVQTVDAPQKDALTNGFSFLASTGIAVAWGTIQTMTIELYPTVIRNIAFGSLSVLGRVGGMVGPQLVYLNRYVTGLLFYVCGGVSLVCFFGCLGLPETMNANLADKIAHKPKYPYKHTQLSSSAI